MHPFIHILWRDVPSYGIMMLAGICAGLLVTTVLCGPLKKNRTINRTDVLLTSLIAIAGAITGAYLLRPLIKIVEVAIRWDYFSQVLAGDLINYIFGEIVFYGGLIGGVAAAMLFCRKFKISFVAVSDAIAPAIPAGHAIGRIGCLMGGCCYGIEVDPGHPFAIVYPQQSLLAPHGVPLLAVPVIEAVVLVVISAIVIFAYVKIQIKGLSVGLYLFQYSIARFVLEFFRGDALRGVYGGISTSQIISMVIFAASVLWLVYFIRKSKKQHPENIEVALSG